MVAWYQIERQFGTIVDSSLVASFSLLLPRSSLHPVYLEMIRCPADLIVRQHGFSYVVQGQFELLERCSRRFRGDERYKNDLRYLKVWMAYVSLGIFHRGGFHDRLMFLYFAS